LRVSARDDRRAGVRPLWATAALGAMFALQLLVARRSDRSAGIAGDPKGQ